MKAKSAKSVNSTNRNAEQSDRQIQRISSEMQLRVPAYDHLITTVTQFSAPLMTKNHSSDIARITLPLQLFANTV